MPQISTVQVQWQVTSRSYCCTMLAARVLTCIKSINQTTEIRLMPRKVKLGFLFLLICCAAFLPQLEAQKKSEIPVSNPAAKIDDAALKSADAHSGDWITHGRNYAETRFSPLKQISDSNVKNLGLAWSFDTETNRGLEATPIIVDGVMYTTGSWSIVFAIDARTGKQLWKWDP